MGYRSKVDIVTTVEGYTAMKISIAGTSGAELLNQTDRLAINEEQNYVHITWNWLKWYEDYEDVGAILGALKALETADIPYKLCRIGEDETDIEENNSDPDDVLPESYTQTTTEFVFYGDESKEKVIER